MLRLRRRIVLRGGLPREGRASLLLLCCTPQELICEAPDLLR